jgi:hypothetical protein
MNDKAEIIRIWASEDLATGKLIARSPELPDLAIAHRHDSDLRFYVQKEIARLLGLSRRPVIVAPLAGTVPEGFHSVWVAFPAEEARRQLKLMGVEV